MRIRKYIPHIVVSGLVVATAAILATNGSKLGPNDIYPNVPGVTNPNVTQTNIGQTICVSGWTATIRPPASYTTNLKIQQLKSLGYADQNPASYEEDHLISLELGGNPTDPNNLWPEPYNASVPDGGAKFKDQTENYLKSQVCSGNITLQIAQQEIVSDWYKVYTAKVKSNGFGASIVSDPDDQ